MLKTTVLLITLLSLAYASQGQQTGRDIMLKVDEQPDGETRKSTMHMELINKRGSKRERTMQSYSKDYGKDKKTIMFFQQPADVKGTGFLTWDYNDDDKSDDRWLYLPAMKKTRRISGTSAKKEYFMGSDFTYDDLGNRDVDADNHHLIKEETVNGFECWVIESTPKDNDDLYSKKVGWIRKDNYMAVKVEYYDNQERLLKVLEINDLKKVDGFWTATKMTMSNHQRNHKTIIRFESMSFNETIDDNLFTVNMLERGYIQ
ncbi:MAG: outer membrane lipoprotein-sorting protein [Marinilabiliales bacterium]|nr:MAG: outer membrane lipoprotein-sorting protein [Marinilabiliales bacterium]